LGALVRQGGIVRSEPIFHTQTILVVEHDQTIRWQVCRLLSPEGYRVVQACNAEEAVRTAARHDTEIGLLLTETLLPRLFGWELAELLKLDYPGLKVVYLSRSVDAEIRARARPSMVVVLEHPLWRDRLQQAVHGVLDSYKVNVS